MASPDKSARQQNYSFSRAFSHACAGLLQAYREERHIRFHCLAAVLVLLANLLLKVDRLGWLASLIAVGLVFITELTNTAVERFVDLVCQGQHHPLAKFVKDVMAGVVLIAAILSLVIAAIVYGPYLTAWLRG